LWVFALPLRTQNADFLVMITYGEWLAQPTERKPETKTRKCCFLRCLASN
jgi:hypothetical protein